MNKTVYSQNIAHILVGVSDQKNKQKKMNTYAIRWSDGDKCYGEKQGKRKEARVAGVSDPGEE